MHGTLVDVTTVIISASFLIQEFPVLFESEQDIRILRRMIWSKVYIFVENCLSSNLFQRS